MTGWDFAALWWRIAAVQPHQPALLHGGTAISWAQFDGQAAAVAAALRSAGLDRGDVVAICLPNVPEHLVCLAACLRSGMTPANVNPRYREPELDQLMRQLRPSAVFFDARHADLFAELRPRMPRILLWCQTDGDTDHTEVVPLSAIGADDTARDSRPDSSPLDLMIKCTGGTTGAPAAVLWPVGDMFAHLNQRNPWASHDTSRPLPDNPLLTRTNARLAVAGPLAHGSAMTRALGALCAGGAVITTPGQRYSPETVLDSVDQHDADTLAIVGDAHAWPLIDALDEHPDRWDLTMLTTVTSSGAAWTAAAKTALLDRLPHLQLLESLGATEATGLGFSAARSGDIPPTGVFTLGRHARIFTPSGGSAAPGDTGRIGVSWPHPVGLHPTGDLPADRFLRAGGTLYLLSGDHVRVLDDRRFTFLGRDQDCINTGGEKVYAPEVANLLAEHPHVADAAVFAIPDPRMGNAVAALLQLQPGGRLDDVLAHARRHLAGYKIPTHVRLTGTVPRTPAGKIDLQRARAIATTASDERGDAT